MNNGDEAHQIQVAADDVAAELEADVLFFNGSLERGSDRHVIELCRERRRKKNVLLTLVTYGGDAHEAYRMARCLQRNYTRFIMLISGFCKSAGTLVATGAHELAQSDDGELGPIDVQLWKKDEVFETQSGLTAPSALDTLNQQAFRAFEKYFLDLKRRGRPGITARLAMDVAAKMAIGLYAPIYQQLDPVHLGETGRQINIAIEYGRRLAHFGQNLDPDSATLEHLTSHYPSHVFVIDREESESIFHHVRKPSAKEEKLIALLKKGALEPVDGEDGSPLIAYLSTELPATVPGVGILPAAEKQEGGGTDAQAQPQKPEALLVQGGSPATTSHPDGAEENK